MSITTRPTRQSVPLTEQDWADIEMVKTSPGFQESLGLGSAPSNSEVTRALLREGLRSLRENNESKIYQEMAKDAQLISQERAQRSRLSQRGRDITKD